MSRLISAFAIASLALSACSGEVGPGGTGGDDDDDTTGGPDGGPGPGGPDGGIGPGGPDGGPITPQSGPYFPNGAIWYSDVSAAALDAESPTVIGYLDNLGWATDGIFQIDFSIEVMQAPAGTPMQMFEPTDDFYDPDCDLVTMPVPIGGAIEGEPGYECLGDGDCHLLVADYASMQLYEMWRANVTGGTFYGGCLAVWDMSKVYGPKGRGDQCTSADAAGYPIAPLLATADEVAAGSVNHALRFILPNENMRDAVYVRPATHGTPATSGPAAAPPYGTRLRLRADFDESQLPNEGSRVIARTLKKYGMFLADGGNVPLTLAGDRYTTAKWDGLLDPHDLDGITPGDFEMIEAGERIPLTLDCVREP